jgi:pantetheine-phosphate adenylyltransferase
VIRRAVYAGSFDPITNGHLDIVARAQIAFDEIVVAVAYNPGKETSLFSVKERVDLIRQSLAERPGVRVDSFSGLLVDYCDRIEATAIIRGLRAVSDFEYEFQMAMMNRHLNGHVETFFIAASETYFYTASRLVKEVASLGGNVTGFVPPVVHKALTGRFSSGS